jgi:tetratricopeptide (TPR) repeat protein
MLRKILPAAVCAVFAIVSYAQLPYDSIAAKAGRFYKQHEWRSALAMYDLMLDERPGECPTYVNALVAAGMASDTLSQQRLTRRAIEHIVVVDSLFSGVERASVAIGRPTVYEEYLENIASAEPWLQRAVDQRLLHYFAFRRIGPETVKYARRMLAGLPDDIGYLRLLAQGYLDCNDIEGAENVYKRIIGISPDDLTALLYLGNSEWARGNKKAGAEYLRRAYNISPTPYLEKKLGIKTQGRR